MSDLDVTGRVVVDSSPAEGAFKKVGVSADKMAKDIEASAQKSSKAVDGIGAGAEQGAQKFTRAGAQIRSEIQRSTAQLENFGKTASQRLELKITAKGLDPAQFAPYLAKLKEVEVAQAAAAAATGNVGSSLAGLGSTVAVATRALGALGVALSAREFITLADASTNVASKLGLVTSSATELIAVQERLFSIAQASRVSFVDLVGTYAQVARSTKDLGISQNALLGVVQTISQAVTISGGSAASAQAALTQLSQGFASGALRGEELNSILEQTPRLAQALADGLGVGVGKLRELGQAGELTSEKVLGALEKSAAGVAAEFGKMALTVGQASTQAGNSVLNLVGTIDKIVGASGFAAAGISRMSQGIDALARDLERLGRIKSFGDFFFVAFNNERSLNGELEITQKELAKLEARLAKAPNNIYARSAVAEMQAYVKEIKEAQARLAQLSGQGGPADPRDQSGFTGRGASANNETKRLAKLAEDANAFRLKLAGIPESYVKDMEKLISLNKDGQIVGEEFTRMLKQQQDVLLKKADGSGAAAAADKAEQTAYESLVAGIRTKIEANKLELEGDAALTEGQRIRIKLDQDLAAGRIKLGSANEASVRADIKELETTDAAVLAKKTLAKADADASQARQKYTSGLEVGLDKIRAETEAQIEATERLGLTKEAVADLDAAKLESAATIQDLIVLKKIEQGVDQDQYQIYVDTAAELRKLANAKKAYATRSAGIEIEKESTEAAKKAEEEWRRASESINNSLTDALLRGFESGKGFAENMRDTIVNMFKTMVLRPVISAIVNPVAGTITSALGLGGGVGGGGGNGPFGALNNANSLYSNGSSLYTVGSQYLGGTMSGANAAGTLYANATTTGGGTALDALLATNNAYGTAAGSVTAGAGAGGGAASSPGIGAAGMATIVFAVIALLASRDATRVRSTGDSNTTYDSAGKAITRTNNRFSDGGGYTAVLTDGRTQESVDAENAATAARRTADLSEFDTKSNNYVDSLNATYLAAAKRLGFGAVGTAFSFGSNDSDGGKFRLASTAGDRSFDSGEIALNEASLKLAANRAVLNALSASELPKYLQGVFEGVDAATLDQSGIDATITKVVELKDAYATLQQIPGADLTNISYETLQSVQGVVNELATVNTAFFSFGQTLLDVSAAGGAAAANLVSAFGGLAAAQSQFSSYYQNFFSQEEQQANTYSTVQADLQKAGITYSVDQLRAATRGDIRAAVDSFAGGAGTPEGSVQYAAAVKAANLLATVKPAVDAIVAAQPVNQVGSSGGGGGGGGSAGETAANQIANAWQQITDSIFEEVKRIRGLIEGTGDTAFAAAQARFSIATAQARAGDQEAASALPELSQALLELAESNVGTKLELQRIRAQTSASLRFTATEAATRYGLSIPAFAGGGYHGGGWAMVGENGPELANFSAPARIYNPADTLALQGGDNSNAVIVELKAQNKLLTDLLEKTGLIEGHTDKTRSVLVQVTQDGEAMQTEAAE